MLRPSNQKRRLRLKNRKDEKDEKDGIVGKDRRDRYSQDRRDYLDSQDRRDYPDSQDHRDDQQKDQRNKIWKAKIRSYCENLRPLPIIGVDEVGRGCLAGPVCAAAVVLSELPYSGDQRYRDSKLISPQERERLCAEIRNNHRVGIGVASVSEITFHNIQGATFLAMIRALKNLGLSCGHVIVDGRLAIPDLYEKLKLPQTPIVKADTMIDCVSAASIVAKVYRDHLMIEMNTKIPGYRFDLHKGYPTPLHKELILMHGPSHQHRPTFAGVKEYFNREVHNVRNQ